MKEVGRKKNVKQIISIMVVIMLCNFIVPNVTYANNETKNGGSIFDPLIKFTTFLCDSVMQFMQNSFTSNQSIDNGDGTYDFQYSPAIIFSGTVQGFDINFIKPNTDIRNTNNFEAFLRTMQETYIDEAVHYPEWSSNTSTYNEKLEAAKSNEGAKVITESSLGPGFGFTTSSVNRTVYYEKDNNLYVEFFRSYTITTTSEYGMQSHATSYYYNSYVYNIETDLAQMNEVATYTSIASELQPTIATWYNALRRIALVGLLSVLVYLGIRVILSSSSAEGNSKYKKMLTDWLIALCLLFTLHYLMSFILLITQKLPGLFNLGTTDELLNTLRQSINQSKSWGAALAEVIMYVVIVIFTITFTFQYLKRVLYMAFFTMIAPLITLTYPIDKVSDGKAQAFNMWLREYIFNALIQVIHLIVYYTLIGSAMELVKLYPIYAIVAIGFMTQGEKIIRSMFGFNNAETIGTMGATATGGLVATAMNKLKSLPTGSKGGKSGGEAKSGGNSKNVRTTTNNPLSGLQGNNSGNAGTNTVGGTSLTTSSTNTTPTKNIGGGVKSLIGKHYKQVGGATLGALAGGAGAIIGFAAGVAQGDVGAAFAGAMAGGAAGKNLGQEAANLPGNVSKGVKNTINNIGDTWNAGAYGEEYANNAKFDREFRNSSTYKALKENPNFSDESVQSMLDAGITDKGAMEKILNSGGNVDEAIGYYSLAQKCPDDIYYDDAKLEMYLQDLGLSQTDAKTMRTNMKAFR